MSQTNQFSARCRDLSAKGLGVFDHPDGRVVFVAGTWPGDDATIEVDRWEKRYGFGRLVQINEPSDTRKTPECPKQGFDKDSCGGCPWMIGNYDDQLSYKEKFVRHYLGRAGVNLDDANIRPITASPKQLFYRNRAQFKTDGMQLGYVAQGSRDIVDIEECRILSEPNQRLLTSLRAHLPNKDWRPVDDQNWVYLDIDEDTDLDQLKTNRRRPFQQGNHDQNDFMRAWLAARIEKSDPRCDVLELFCGSGNFTSVISELGFKHIVSVEAGRESIAKLKSYNLSNVTAETCDLSRIGTMNYLGDLIDPSILVVNPPRAGFRLLEKYESRFSNLQEIFYVSCDVAAFSNDIKKLVTQRGWQVAEVQPVDQFPHTHHVEVLAHLSRSRH